MRHAPSLPEATASLYRIPPRVQPANKIRCNSSRSHNCWHRQTPPATHPKKSASAAAESSRGKKLTSLSISRQPLHTAVFFESALFSLDIDRSHRCCSRPLWGTSRACSRPRREPGQPRREGESVARTLEAARTRVRPGMGQGSSTAPPSADRRGATREAATKAASEARTVRFDPCVRVVLVPSRRDIDRATKHAVWWGRADVRQFRRNAYHFYQEHGTLSVVSNEELGQAGPPPGMPPPPFLRADSGNVAGDSAGLPKDPLARRRRYHQRRPSSGTTGRHATPGPDNASGEPQREEFKGCKPVSEPGPEGAADREVAKGIPETQKATRRQVYREHESRFTTVAFVVL